MVRRGKFFYDKKSYPRWKKSGSLVHRSVAAKKVGGSIWPGRVVHHKDGNPHNFRRENLQVMTRSAHSKLHTKKKRFW